MIQFAQTLNLISDRNYYEVYGEQDKRIQAKESIAKMKMFDDIYRQLLTKKFQDNLNNIANTGTPLDIAGLE